MVRLETKWLGYWTSIRARSTATFRRARGTRVKPRLPVSGPGLNAGIHKPQLSDEKRFLSEALVDARVGSPCTGAPGVSSKPPSTRLVAWALSMLPRRESPLTRLPRPGAVHFDAWIFPRPYGLGPR